MTTKRILAIIIALLTLVLIFSGCSKKEEEMDETSFFKTIVTEDIGNYKQTLVYDQETKVEYVYLYHRGSGPIVSSMLYMPDGTPKLYSGEASKLVLVSTEKTGHYIHTLMYDSETSVMYNCSWHKVSGYTTMQPLYEADGTLKLH